MTKSKAQQQSTGEMLKAHSASTKFCQTDERKRGRRISAAIPRPKREGVGAAMQSSRLSVMRMVGRTWRTIPWC
ncbi:hypothetical protein [Klebsiella pneumoniae]|uniref:hypothetical protein n=1 Tax=Klebsiella pneumoniae TaxID=573 RepID=UPI003B2868AC